MITVQQIKQAQEKADADIIEAAEKRIDAALMRYDGRPVMVDFGGENMPHRVLQRLCEMYRAGGWTASVRAGDQRDPGPWIEFDMGSGPRSGP